MRLACFGLLALLVPAPLLAAPRASSPAELVALFEAWRAFQQPRWVDGVPDYSAPAMATQHRGLPAFQARLRALDTRGWPVALRVDVEVVRAEMAGLDFDHRVLRPWANDPAFYTTVFWEQSDQPAREGPFAAGAVELWRHRFPLDAKEAAELEQGLRRVPALLRRAQANLTGNGHDLWAFGAKALRAQAADLATLDAKLAVAADAGAPSPVLAATRRAQAATEQLAAWVEAKVAGKTGSSAIGVAHYDWYLKHVQLVPHTWREEVALMERELARALTWLTLEEHRNAGLPVQAPIASAEEHALQVTAALARYLAFLAEHQVRTLPGYLEPALRAQQGPYRPEPREFFSEITERDPEVLLTHGYHWFDLARMEHEPHPDVVRRGPLLYNLFNTRTEGHATAFEELMLQAGMFEGRPRSRELVAILLAERAARALAALRMIAGEFTLEQAAAFASAHTPRGWLSLQGQLVRDEQHLYLRQPGYGTSYLSGKMELEKLLAARREQLGAAFTLKQYQDELDAAGLIPASLLRWELTGALPEDVRRMLTQP